MELLQSTALAKRNQGEKEIQQQSTAMHLLQYNSLITQAHGHNHPIPIKDRHPSDDL